MMTVRDADRLEGEINRLLASEQFARAEGALREYAAQAVETAQERSAEQVFLRAKEFLRTSLQLLRSQRSHLNAQLTQVRATKAYSEPNPPQHGLDIKA